MATQFPTFVDVEPGTTPPDGTPDVDAAYLNSISGAVNVLENAMPTKADESALHTIATSGAYDDLIGQPFIPTEPEDLGAAPEGDYATNTALAGKANSSHTHDVGDFDVTGTPDATTYLRGDGTWSTIDIGGGVADHGALTGLGDDDHPQYLNETRGDARYYPQAEVDSALAGKANSSHTHAASGITSGTLSVNRLPRVLSPVRSESAAASMTLDPSTAGTLVNVSTTINITDLDVSTSGANDRQVLRIAVLADGTGAEVTFSSNISTSTGLSRGPHVVPAGEVLLAAVEYCSLLSGWALTAATVTES